MQNENNFLPKGYEVPDNVGNYMKFQKGENRFRVLGSAIVGYEYWNKDGKPVRVKEQPQGTPADIQIKDGKAVAVKHFWAFPVWNYEHSAVQILEITQATIQRAIETLWNNGKWGSPARYDICVTKSGEGLDTEYSINPEPHTELSEEQKKAYASKPINLDALFSGTDPFKPEDPDVTTPMRDYPVGKDEGISPEEIPF